MANNRCVISKIILDTSSQSMTPDDAITAVGIVTEEGTMTDSYQNVRSGTALCEFC
jgi:hypothetical protein